jgi:hypothetical protein
VSPNLLGRAPRGVMVALLLVLAGRGAQAQAKPASVVTEVVVNGPAGALLFVDGNALGRLPLSDSLILAAGAHSFQLQRGNQKVQSDILTLPANRRAELNLTLAGHNLVAVLSITPAIWLMLAPRDLPDMLRQRITAAIGTMARQEHTVLLGRDQQSGLEQRQAAITRCLDSGDCHEPISSEGDTAYVLRAAVASDRAGDLDTYHLRAELLDLRTRELGASAEQSCNACSADAVAAQLAELSRRLLTETVNRPRSTLSVTTSPPGAKVLVDNRWLGHSPYQKETFAGPHIVKVHSDGYLAQVQQIQLAPGQTATVELRLHPARGSKSSRPRWRLVTGGLLLGSGLVLTGFAASALAANGQCRDGSNNFASCSPFYNTLTVGTGLLGSGAALVITGTVLLALPAHQAVPGPSAY